jgi:hypothetical protein
MIRPSSERLASLATMYGGQSEGAAKRYNTPSILDRIASALFTQGHIWMEYSATPTKWPCSSLYITLLESF